MAELTLEKQFQLTRIKHAINKGVYEMPDVVVEKWLESVNHIFEQDKATRTIVDWLTAYTPSQATEMMVAKLQFESKIKEMINPVSEQQRVKLAEQCFKTVQIMFDMQAAVSEAIKNPHLADKPLNDVMDNLLQQMGRL